MWCVLVLKASARDCPAASMRLAKASPIPDIPPSFCPIACRADASAGVIKPLTVILCRMLVAICLPAAMSAGLKWLPMKFLMSCAAAVPMCGSIACCSSFNKAMEREEYIYPPATSMCGRYFVLALFRVFVAMSFFTFAMLSCLLFLNARALHESRDNVSAFSEAKGRRAHNAKNTNRVTFYCLFFYVFCSLSS